MDKDALNRSLARRLLDHIDNHTTDEAESVLEVPAELYTSEAHFRDELEVLFLDQPLVLALSGSLPKPGTYHTVQMCGTPVLLKDVATVRIGPAPPSGATLRAGAETVSGTVIMLKGENGKQLIERVKSKIAGLRLPPGVRLIPFYDQAFVIDGTIRTVEKNLFEGFVLVTIILLLALFWR